MKQTSTAKAERARPHPAPKSARAARADLQVVAASGVDAPQRDEMVRQLAYRYYEERGREDGHDLEDWLKAAVEVDSGFAPLPDH